MQTEYSNMKRLSEYVDDIKFFIKSWKVAITYIVAWVFLYITFLAMNEFVSLEFYIFEVTGRFHPKIIFFGILIYLFSLEFRELLHEHKKRTEYKILIVTYESFLTLFFKLIFATIFWTIVVSIIIFIWLLLGNKTLLNNLKELLF